MYFKLAWRNIWRNWRRAVITMAAIMFAVFLTIIMRGMQLGTYDKNIQNTLEMMTSYLQIQVVGYLDNPTLRKTFDYDNKIKSILNSEEKVLAYTPRINADGLIGNKTNSFGTGIIAVNPETEIKVSKLHERVKTGDFVNSKNIYGIVIGYKLLENLQAKIGDEIVILSSGYDGTMGNLKFKIIGTSKFGQTEFDKMSVFMHIDAARELLSMGNKISAVAIKIDNLHNVDEVKSNLNNKLNAVKLNNDYKLSAFDWGELLPSLKQSIEFDNAQGILTLGILLAIVAFGILNTVVMSITERYREFGVLIALGMRQIKLAVIVFLETIFITLIGSFVGIVLGYIFNYYIVQNPIKFSGEFASMYEEFGWEAAMYSSLEPSIFISTLISIFSIVLIVYFFPAYRLMKLEALKGIRYT
ncbi:MAG: FtsX-like permease family protein [bacterium]